MTRIKICGLSTIRDIEAVNILMPDYIGFVFARSSRQVTDITAKGLKKALNEKIKAVGVFVNESIDNILSICDQGIIDMVQLHGDEDEAYIRRLKARTDKPLIGAFRIRSIEDIKRAELCSADYVLLDSYTKGAYGGSGHSFPWDMAKEMKRDFFLAGGIQVSNITEAVSRCNPYCIDVSSGVETEGRKDIIKIEELIKKIEKTH